MKKKDVANSTIFYQYKESNRKRSIKLMLIGGIIFLIAMPILFYADIVYNGMPLVVFYWRLSGFVMSLVSIVVVLSPLKKNSLLIDVLFNFNLFVLLFVIYGMLSYITNPVMLSGYLSGVLLAIFTVFLVANKGFKSLILIYAIPLIMAIFLFKINQPNKSFPMILSFFTNPIIATILLPVFGEMFEKRRFDSFQTNMLFEEKNNIFVEELQLAKKIQQALLPSKTPKFEGLNLSMAYKPMEEVGGDFFDFLYFKEHELLGIFISDVSGHGVPAAFVTSIIKTIIDSSGAVRKSPKRFLAHLNKKSLGLTGDNFFTAFYAIYNNETRTLTYSRAGHNYPYLIRNNTITELKAKGKILGLFEGISFQEKKIQLYSGDRIIFYTDGLTESLNAKGEDFEHYVKKKTYQKVFTLSGVTMAKKILDELNDFIKDREIDDDICIITLEVK